VVGRSRFAGERIELNKQMSVAGKDERNIQPFAGGVEFALFQSVTGRKIFRLGFDEGNGDGLGLGINRNAERVINPPSRPLARFAVNDFYRARRFLAPNQIFRPAASVNGRVNQFGASVGFAEWHGFEISGAAG